MATLAQEFIEFALSQEILKFGSFTLKSGRTSPYFFNAGLFYNGEQLSILGDFYAKKLIEANIDFDVLFGPAYKGLPLATTTATSLFKLGNNCQVSFNRKEAKKHGEQGLLIGAPLAGKKVVIIDDVITAGTAFREARELIKEAGGHLKTLIIALNRQELGQDKISAIEEIQQKDNIPVLSIITLENIIEYLERTEQSDELDAIKTYRSKWGSK